MSKAVVAGQLLHWSPSQVTVYDRCKRKWFIAKVLGIPEPKSDQQNLGTEIHKQLETYLSDGSLPSSAIASGALPFLPPPATEGIYLEQPLEDPTLYAMGVPAKGFIDFLDARDPLLTIVRDYKTTGSPRNCKTVDELGKNVQLITYGQWAAEKYEPDQVKLEHLYLFRDGSAPKSVSATLTRGEIQGRFAEIEYSVAEMKATASLETYSEVEPNWNACNDYGGCPYLSRCGRTVGQRLSIRLNAMENASMAIADKLKSTTTTSTVAINPPDAAKPETPPKYVPPAATNDTGNARLLGDSFELYVDCVVEGPGVMAVGSLERYTASLAAQVAAENSTADVGLIDFAKGKGLLRAAARGSPPKGLVIGRSGDLTNPVIEALIPLASKVVRGVR